MSFFLRSILLLVKDESGSSDFPRKLDDEGRTLADFTLNVNRTVLGLDNSLGDKQSEAQTRDRAVAGNSALKLLENSFVIAWGGRHMRNLTSYGWALTGGIMCIVFGVILFGLVCCSGILHIPLGIWALVAVNNRAARRGFSFDQRRRRQTWD